MTRPSLCSYHTFICWYECKHHQVPCHIENDTLHHFKRSLNCLWNYHSKPMIRRANIIHWIKKWACYKLITFWRWIIMTNVLPDAKFHLIMIHLISKDKSSILTWCQVYHRQFSLITFITWKYYKYFNTAMKALIW